MDALEDRVERLSPACQHGAGTPAWLAATAIAIAVAGLLFLWIWDRASEERAIRDMPAPERAGLYRRTFEDLTGLCGPGRAGDLAEHCERQARFILKFPECDAGCQRLAGVQLAPAR
ncbi:MAG TPA: hypothetical protein VK698_23950 [Kofleriaceae bacterium]|nr:hypothetical protein [Kofleriaceae bacterium]